MPLPAVLLTAGRHVDLATFGGRTVVYGYPRTGRPDQQLPVGWNTIPGARRCTPRSCGFRDHFHDLQRFGAWVFGLSTRDTDYQGEVVERLHLSFELLSDAELTFARLIRLPTFEVEGTLLIKRLTVIIADGRLEKVFHPVFPPDATAAQVIAGLSAHPGSPATR